MFRLFLFLSFAVSAFCCEVPVFRYALERWVADDYELELSLPENLTEEQKALVEALKNQSTSYEGLANYKINENSSEDGSLSFKLYYPEKTKIFEPLLEGELNQEVIADLASSELRKKVISKLIEGSSAVWILLESGLKEDDDAAEFALKRGLDEASSKIKLSEEIVGHGESFEEKEKATGKEVDLENVLRSGIPLKVQFDIIRLSRNDAKEQFFIKSLLAHSPRLANYNGVVAIPIFGRGRVLEGLPAEALKPEILAKATEYICGKCSCTVKEQNPGVDMLMAYDWDKAVSNSLLIQDRSLPPVIGTGDIMAAEQSSVEKREAPLRPDHQALNSVELETVESDQMNPAVLNGILAFLVLGVILLYAFIFRR